MPAIRLATIIVPGRPISIQAKHRQQWIQRVRQAAIAKLAQPVALDDLRIVITFFYRLKPSFDTDNISKPICDALNGVAYNDDSQITDRHARRRSLNGSYYLADADPDLVLALQRAVEFVCIEIFALGDEVNQL